ncbi:hybrid sensor histidine kinase/response regulator [Deferrisoma camini]|uniref:hybrid sensor histidine kinase/response regulator n=1 Tax=Deferrisoma camini TaxID=1035120 RepID=UPI00046CD94F|nr:response regulator [Deferrisoma camini]
MSPPRLRVIIADDNPDDRTLALRELRKEFPAVDATEVGDQEAWEAALAGEAPDLVVTDYHLRWSDGLVVLRQARTRWPGVPVIMFTGTGTQEVAVEAMKQGLADYVVKSPRHFARLAVAARNSLERAAKERALAEAEARYQDLVENLPVGIYVSTPSGRILTVNRAFVEILGYPDTESLIRLDARALWADPAQRDRWIRALETQGRVAGFVGQLLRADGTPVWVEGRASAIRDPRGRLVAWQGSAVDVTERVLAQKERERALREVEAVLEAVPAGIALLTPGGTIRRANGEARALMEAHADLDDQGRLRAVAGRPLPDLLAPPDDGRQVHEMFTPGPAPRVLQVQARPVGDPDRPEAWVMVIRDATAEHHRFEKIALQERLAALGQLAAGIAHDFNNILSAIVGYAEMLRGREDIPSDVRERLEQMLVQSFRAADLVRQVLDFGRRAESERQPLDLLSFAKELTRLFQTTFPAGIRVRMAYEPGSYWVLADPTQIQQILTNLAVNARDAMPEGGELTIRLACRPVVAGEAPPVPGMKPGDYVCLSVTDTGCGIAPEHLDRVFEPFYTTKPSDEGTGLGLSQVYGLVREHGGFVDLHSTPGAGTEVSVYLPAAERAHGRRSTVIGAVPEGAGQTVLLAEDDVNVREILRAILERLNYRVLEARDGDQALALWERHADTVDAVVTDLVMPGLDGREFARRVKARKPGVPVIAVSGYPLPRRADRRPDDGFDEWMPKPIHIRELARALARLLAAGPGR